MLCCRVCLRYYGMISSTIAKCFQSKLDKIIELRVLQPIFTYRRANIFCTCVQVKYQSPLPRLDLQIFSICYISIPICSFIFLINSGMHFLWKFPQAQIFFTAHFNKTFNSYSNKSFFLIFYSTFTQLMQFKQSFITRRTKTMSQSNRPIIYADQVPGYSGQNQNIRNPNNVSRIRGPHSTKSDPLNNLKKEQSNMQKTTSVSSKEQQLIEEIKNLKTKQEKLESQMDAQMKRYKQYRELSEERRDEKMVSWQELRMQQCLEIIKEYGRNLREANAERRELRKKLQQLQAKKI